jgi:intergrase/recombinase
LDEDGPSWQRIDRQVEKERIELKSAWLKALSERRVKRQKVVNRKTEQKNKKTDAEKAARIKKLLNGTGSVRRGTAKTILSPSLSAQFYHPQKGAKCCVEVDNSTVCRW